MADRMTNLSGTSGDGKATAAQREAAHAEHAEETQTGTDPVTAATPADGDDVDA